MANDNYPVKEKDIRGSRADYGQRSEGIIKTASALIEEERALECVIDCSERSEKPDYCSWEEFYISVGASIRID